MTPTPPLEITDLPLSWFVERLAPKTVTPFTFARYGDGEFNCILGDAGENCDHHQYFPELGADLRMTLEQPRDYVYALGPKAAEQPRVREYVERLPARRWVSSETFLHASLKGTLLPLVDALRHRVVMVIGPAHLRQLSDAHRIDVPVFVEIPPVNAYLKRAEISRAIMYDAYQVDTLAFSAGMLTEVLLWELYPNLGQTHALIDFGSLWDVYHGVKSRRYARQMDAQRLAWLTRANFGN